MPVFQAHFIAVWLVPALCVLIAHVDALDVRKSGGELSAGARR
jgi:hypothetical protein